MITPNEYCRNCRYADCSTTQWPCRVCKRIHDYDDYFVPKDGTEDISNVDTKPTYMGMKKGEQ